MSLGDRYNRGEGRLAAIDRYLTHLGDRAARSWFDRTGTSATVLTQGLYVVAAWASVQHLTLFRDPIVVVFASYALFALLGLTQSRGGLVEQIQAEAAGLPKWWFALCRLIVLGMGLFQLAVASGLVLEAVVVRSPGSLGATDALLLGCAMTALQAGDYIGRANPFTPSDGYRQLA